MDEVAALIKASGNTLVLGCAEDPNAQTVDFNSNAAGGDANAENPYSQVRVFTGQGVVRRGSHIKNAEAFEPENDDDAAVNALASSLSQVSE